MDQHTAEHLQDLIRINVDSYRGFEQAAATIESQPIANMFRAIARDRLHHLGQLRQLVVMTDAEVDDGGSIKGKVHRWWLSARGALNGGDDHVVLLEADRGEEAIKCCYEHALEDVTEPAVRQVLRNQYVEVTRGHDAVRGLRDLTAIE